MNRRAPIAPACGERRARPLARFRGRCRAGSHRTLATPRYTMTDKRREEASRQIREAGLIAIIRGSYGLDALRSMVGALREGGVRVVKITLSSDDALEGIAALRRYTDDHSLIGAGTVRTAQDVNRAIEADAQFLVSPNFDPASAARACEADVLHLPGVFMASEAQSAFAAGCQMQKLFPARQLGPSYLKALRAPLNAP